MIDNWPFEGHQNTHVALVENEFDTPAIWEGTAYKAKFTCDYSDWRRSLLENRENISAKNCLSREPAQLCFVLDFSTWIIEMDQDNAMFFYWTPCLFFLLNMTILIDAHCSSKQKETW